MLLTSTGIFFCIESGLLFNKHAREPYTDFIRILANANPESACQTEHCFVYVPRYRKHMYKRLLKEKNETGVCVSNDNGKEISCTDDEPNPDEIREKLVELNASTWCDGHPEQYCYENADELNTYHKKFYKKMYDHDQSKCVWKDLHSDKIMSDLEMIMCPKQPTNCESLNYLCSDNTTKVRHQINSQGKCQAINTCDDSRCDTSRELTCYEFQDSTRTYEPVVYTERLNRSNLSCSFYDSGNTEIPNLCTINTKIDCGEPIVCNGRTHVGRLNNTGSKCEYLDQVIIHDYSDCTLIGCGSNMFYDYASDECTTCGDGQFLINPDANSADAACQPIQDCTNEYTPCFEMTDVSNKYKKVLYQQMYDPTNNTCVHAYDLKEPCYTKCTYDIVTEEDGEEYCIVPKEYELFDIKNVI
jgi:hypothetical protein